MRQNTSFKVIHEVTFCFFIEINLFRTVFFLGKGKRPGDCDIKQTLISTAHVNEGFLSKA